MASLETHGLVEQIYDGACDEAAFNGAIGAIREQVGAHANVAFALDANGAALWSHHGIDPKAFAAYDAHYHRFDLYKEALAASDQLRSGFVFTEQTLVSPEAMRRSPLVHELLAPNGLGPILGCPAYVATSGSLVEFAFYRPPGAEPFAQCESALLRAMAPHLGRASRIRLKLAEAASVPTWTVELLDGLSWGVVLLDGVGRVLLVNREARRILTATDGLVLGRSGLRATHHNDARKLAHLIVGATRGIPGHEARCGGSLAVSRPSAERPWFLTVVPIGSRDLLRIGTAIPRAAAHILDPLRQPVDPGTRLRALFGFSPAEQRLALDLVHGLTLAEAADRRAVALSTVKTQLLQLFTKTGTNRQSQLVALLLGFMAVPTDNQSAP